MVTLEQQLLALAEQVEHMRIDALFGNISDAFGNVDSPSSAYFLSGLALLAQSEQQFRLAGWASRSNADVE